MSSNESEGIFRSVLQMNIQHHGAVLCLSVHAISKLDVEDRNTWPERCHNTILLYGTVEPRYFDCLTEHSEGLS
jgi:hypothetical protein